MGVQISDDGRNSLINELSERTRRHYADRANQLIKSANGETEDVSYVVTANFLKREAESQKLAPSTVRLYRSALLFVFATHPTDESATAEDIVRSINTKSSIRRQSSRVRQLPEKDFRRLVGSLLATTSRRSDPLNKRVLAAYWLGAIVDTGMRPIEVFDAEIHSKELRIFGAKQRESAHSERFLAITPQTSNFLASLQSSLNAASIAIQHIHKLGVLEARVHLITEISRILRRESERLWDSPAQRYTLYSARHQAAANFRYLDGVFDAASALGHELRTNAIYGSAAQPWAATANDG